MEKSLDQVLDETLSFIDKYFESINNKKSDTQLLAENALKLLN